MQPGLVGPIVVYPFDAQTVCVPFGFVLANLVFLERVDIRVVVVDDGFNVMCHQPFHDRARTGGTARVQ